MTDTQRQKDNGASAADLLAGWRAWRAAQAADEIKRLTEALRASEAAHAQAAAEIERLRTALQTAADALQEAGCSYAWAAAHAALLKERHD